MSLQTKETSSSKKGKREGKVLPDKRKTGTATAEAKEGN